MRYVGQGHEIVASLPVRPLAAADRTTLRAAFDDTYCALYGRLIPDLDVEVLSWGLNLSSRALPIASEEAPAAAYTPEPAGRRRLLDLASGEPQQVAVYHRAALQPGATLAGPALIAEDDTTILVPPAALARVDRRGYLWIERQAGAPQEKTP
jgi:N-methylhydantoinase A